MEPTDLNSPSREDACLAAVLRENAPSLPDNGFSARVLAALPPPRRRPALGVRAAVCSLGGAVGLVFAWQQGISFEALSVAMDDQMWESLRQAGSTLNDWRFAVAIAVTALSLGYAFFSEMRRALPFWRAGKSRPDSGRL